MGEKRLRATLVDRADADRRRKRLIETRKTLTRPYKERSPFSSLISIAVISRRLPDMWAGARRWYRGLSPHRMRVGAIGDTVSSENIYSQAGIRCTDVGM